MITRRGMIICVLALLCANGCVETTDDAGDKQTEFSPGAKEAMDKISEGTKAAVEAIGPYVPEPIRYGLEILGGLALVLGQVKNMKIKKGSKAAAQVIEKHVRGNSTAWAEAKVILKTAEAAGAIMPNKL